MSDAIAKKELKTELDSFAAKIFKYFDKRFDEHSNRFDSQELKIDNLTSAVDAYAKQVEIYYQESLVRDAQVNRIQAWVEQIAQKNGVKLEY